MKNYEKKVFISLTLISIFLLIFDFFIGDEKIFLFINKSIENKVLDFLFLKVFIPLFFLLPVLPFLMLFFKDRKIGIFSLISGPTCYLIGNLIKFIFRFPRPSSVLSARLLGPWHISPYSFPSTTTMLAFGFAIPVLLKKPKLGILSLILAILVGFSVIYTGYHFPKDVFSGILFSTLVCFLLEKILIMIKVI